MIRTCLISCAIYKKFRFYQLVVFFDHYPQVKVNFWEYFCLSYFWSVGIKSISIIWWYRTLRYQVLVETWLGITIGLYIALKLVEDQRFVERWAIFCSEIDRRSEACWFLGCILLWNWFKIRGLFNYGLYIALKLIEYHRLV